MECLLCFFLPGFCQNLSIWDGLVTDLSQICQVITVDLLGVGGSNKLLAPTSLINCADQIQHLMQSLDIQEYIIARHSLGGYISLELVKKHPKSILGIGLVHSTAFADDNEKSKAETKPLIL